MCPDLDANPEVCDSNQESYNSNPDTAPTIWTWNTVIRTQMAAILIQYGL
jgi:hypothetical protein